MNEGTLSTDVLIVGGGPAGLATALALRQRGIAVTVADAMRPPIDKACGEGLMPDSLRDLAALGVELTLGEGAGFRGICFVNHRGAAGSSPMELEAATAQFPSDGFGSGMGIGLRRQVLHSRLAAKAEECGVGLRWGSPVQLKAGGQVQVAGETIRYGWLIGADGLNSRVRAWAGLEAGTTLSRRFGFRRHYRVQPWSSFVEVHWGKSGQAYVTPVEPDEVCVATVTRDSHVRMETILEEMPVLRRKLLASGVDGVAQAEISPDRERGALTTTRRLRRVVNGNVALVGDASGSADAITGEGMGMAFRQGLLLADCIAAGNLSGYQERHTETLRLPQTMARVMQLMDRWPGFGNRALRMLSAESELFARMLGVHLGAETLQEFVLSRGFTLAWKMVQPALGLS